MALFSQLNDGLLNASGQADELAATVDPAQIGTPRLLLGGALP